MVRCIYRLALEGNGPLQIATALGTMGALNPSAYRTSKGISKGGSKSTLEPTNWNHTTVKRILTLQEYCGDVINFKTYSKSYKMKRRIENPEENRVIFLNVHDPIIDRVTWEKVQSLQTTRRRRPTVTKESSAFCGYLKCPELSLIHILLLVRFPQHSAKNGGACFSYAASVSLVAFIAWIVASTIFSSFSSRALSMASIRFLHSLPLFLDG